MGGGSDVGGIGAPLVGEVTTLTGQSGEDGHDDGTGTRLTMQWPQDLAIDDTNLYVVDTDRHQIRKIEIATGQISTLAGTSTQGFADGAGRQARFSRPLGVTIDPAHQNLYVSDAGNAAIRKVMIATGEVTTVIGSVGRSKFGCIDGNATEARFEQPEGIVIDSTGTNLYVTDRSCDQIRQVSLATLQVTTIAGSKASGAMDGVGTAAGFAAPLGIAIDATDTNLYVVDDATSIRKVELASGAVSTLAKFSRGSERLLVDPSRALLYVADSRNQTIRKLDLATGVLSNFVGCTNPGSGTCVGAIDGVGAAARFNYPRGLASDGTHLFVADSLNRAIRKIALDTGEVTTVAGSPTPATLSGPKGITAVGNTLYFVDSANSAIREVDASTGYTTTLAGAYGTFGSADGIRAAASFDFPAGITSDGTNLYVADTKNQSIRRIVIATGEVSTFAGSSANLGSADGIGGAARFNSPWAIAIDPSHSCLYVTDSLNHSIRKIVVATAAVSTLAGSSAVGHADGLGSLASFNEPRGIAVDPTGTNLYVSDMSNHSIRKVVVATGEVTTIAGDLVSGSSDGVGPKASFNNPSGLATDGTMLYVADTSNNEIRTVTLATGLVRTLCGTTTGGSKDGLSRSALLSAPVGVALNDSSTYLYVTDFGNSLIRSVRLR
jgi:DNA-binding beta-propeller fold protein YncE